MADVSGLMLTALANVVLCIAHQNPQGTGRGTGPEVGTPAWVALRTALDMMGNIDPMVGGERCDDMRARLEAYAEILEGAAGGGAAGSPPECGLGELRAALSEFVSAHGSAF